MTQPEFTIRTCTPDEWESTARVFTGAMLFDFVGSELNRRRFEPDRALVAEADGRVIGSAKAVTRDMSLPGAVAPVAHVTGVGVGQDFRRRGVLSALMRRQLREVPEALAALWASDTGIYGRYGYAAAAYAMPVAAELPRLGVLPGTEPGTVREIDAATAAPLLTPILQRYQRIRPGVSGRLPMHWDSELEDPAAQRHGASALRVFVHADPDGALDGYAIWRTRMGFDDVGANGEVEVIEMVAPEPAANRALWRLLLSMDLCRKLSYRHATVDDPLLQLVSNTRALSTRRVDTVWLRVTDVPRALELRRYAAPVDLVLDVRDDLIDANNGRFRLTGGPDKARCEPTTAPADVTVPVAELAAIYLGARSAGEFVPTGKVIEHTTGAVMAAGAAFGWPVAPGAIEIF